MAAVVLWPTEAESLGFQTLDELRAHVGLGNASLRAVVVRTGGLANLISNLGALPASVIARTAGAARVITVAHVAPQAAGPGGNPPAVLEVPEQTRGMLPMEATQLGCMWRIARRIVSARNGTAWADTLATDEDPFAPPPVGGGGGGAPPPPPPPAAPAVTKYKHRDYLDQSDETEFVEAPQVDVDRWHGNYVAGAQTAPPREERASTLQLSAMNNRVNILGRTPYGNFASLTAFSDRVTRKNKFQLLQYIGDGKYSYRELPGPANYREWLSSFRVFSTICRSILIVVHAALTAYERRIEHLADKYPDAWGLIYAADDMMRAEELEARRSQLLARATRYPLDPPKLWDAAAPWSAVFLDVAEDEDFWREHVVDPANLWIGRGRPGSSRAALPDAWAAKGHLPGGADLYHGDPDLAGNRRKRTGSASRTPSPTKKKKTRLSTGEKRRRAVAKALAERRRSPSSSKGRGKKRKRERDDSPPARTEVSGQACYAYSKGFGKCAAAKAGSKCPAGRQHKCHVCGGPHSAKEKGCVEKVKDETKRSG